MEPLPPAVRELEMRLGRRLPDSLMRCLQRAEEATPAAAEQSGSGPSEAPAPKLHRLLNTLRGDMARLRALDGNVLQQLLSVNEGLAAARWLLDERGMLIEEDEEDEEDISFDGSSPSESMCSLVDPNQALPIDQSLPEAIDYFDRISVGSFLDTFADETGEVSNDSGHWGFDSTLPRNNSLFRRAGKDKPQTPSHDQGPGCGRSPRQATTRSPGADGVTRLKTPDKNRNIHGYSVGCNGNAHGL
uniref:leucine rich adaptor protein 1-like n=1 Tax=Myxine glutinosa TaxID=7769 RepID=UPI00358FB303